MMDAPTRSIVGREIAARTLGAARQTEADVAVVTGDRGVREWAADLGFSSILELGPSLAGAARAVVGIAATQHRPWVVAHADLPLVDVDDFRAVVAAFEEADYVLAPSYDGGTTVIGGHVPSFDFSYGQGSFRRHLGAAHGSVRILVTPGLALDLDRPSDLSSALTHPRGAWLRSLVDQ